jgi:hypothetical protein
MADTPMTGENKHDATVAMLLLASGRATADEVADLSGLPLHRVQQFVDRLTAVSPDMACARRWWLAEQWNAAMARLEDAQLDEAIRRMDDESDSMVYVPSRYLHTAAD